MKTRIDGLEKRMDRFEERLEKIEDKLEKILNLTVSNDNSLKRINGTIAELKLKDKQHDTEINSLNKFKSGVTYVGAVAVLIIGYVVQIITGK